MKTRQVLGLTLLLFWGPASAQSQEQKAADRLSVAFPDKPWAVVIDAPGFTVQTLETKPDGRRYLYAENKETSMLVSVTLERSAAMALPEECRDSVAHRLKVDDGFEKKNAKLSQIENIPVLEYVVPQIGGIPVRQKNMFACLTNENVYVDIHLSKVEFESRDQSLFLSLLKAIRFVDRKPSLAPPESPAVMAYIREGSILYRQHKYKEAIGPYQKALDLEKETPHLDHTLWRVLVDNLGMAYGISGDLQRAKETFEYGLSKDSTYPMFYYNLACSSAEANDLDKAGEYLKKAFQYKANNIAGESLPDPRKDDSFTPHLNNKKFRDLLDSLMTQAP